MNNNLHLLRIVDSANIESARKEFAFNSLDKGSLKLPSKTNLVFEYQELLDAKESTTVARNNINKRMILFMKNCPNFVIVKTPYYRRGINYSLFESNYDSSTSIFINVTKTKKNYSKIVVFEIKLK